jgi:hypothetical protein
VGDASFSSLYLNVEWMDVRALRRVLELAQAGLPVCLKRIPQEPGKVKSGEYARLLGDLQALPKVSGQFSELTDQPPLIQGDSLPWYWCRVTNAGTHYIFLAQPLSKDLVYPVYSGQSIMEKSVFRDLEFNVNGKTIREKVEFKPYQSVMLKISPDGKLEYLDIGFVPKTPVVREREEQRMYF